MKNLDEIKTGLRVCDSVGRVLKAEGWCKEKCPYMDSEFGCGQDYLLADALEYIQQLEADNAQHARCIENLTDKLNATNEALPRWISVEERLPERGITKCSACVKCGDGLKRVVCASYNAELKLWTGWHGEKIGNEITHWMPLPEPPKEE